MSIFVQLGGRNHVINYSANIKQDLVKLLSKYCTILDSFLCFHNTKRIHSFENVKKYDTIVLQPPLKAGKGGYGAKLKNEGGKKVRPNDNMFSRDSTGRRIAFSTLERQFTEFCKKKMQEDERVQKEREGFKVMESTLKQGQSFMKLDKVYNEQMQKNENRLIDSIRIGRLRQLQKISKLKEDGAFKEEQVIRQRKVEEGQASSCDLKKGQEIDANEELGHQNPRKIIHQDFEAITDSPNKVSCNGNESKNNFVNPMTKEMVLNNQHEVIANQSKDPVHSDKASTTQTKFMSARDKLKSLFKK